MSFCAAISCMDGRVHLPLIGYLQERFGVKYVDLATEPGPVGILAGDPESQLSSSLFSRVDISVGKHGSKVIAVVAHEDCAGNPVSKEEQMKQLAESYRTLKTRYPSQEILALWVDGEWTVHEVPMAG